MPAGDRSDSLPRPRKRYGQHFLADARALSRIVDALAPGPHSTVVEIGPGRGALTDRLASRARRVVAIEIDRDLAAHLRTRYAGTAGVEIVEADALRVDWASVAGGAYVLAGNLPYNLTSPLLFKALEPPQPERAVFLVQLEVAERIVAPEGGKAYGALSVNLRVSMQAEVVSRVPRSAFRPAPRVDSAIIRLTPRPIGLLDDVEVGPFRRFVQAVFGMRRKQLQRVLREVDRVSATRAAQLLDRLGIPPETRPERLTPEQFVTLFRARTEK